MLGKAVLVLWLAVASQLVSEGEGLDCGDAVSALIPCGEFLLGTSGSSPRPTAKCCESAETLDKMATTTATRRDMCQCLKDTGPSFGVKPERAKLLPSYCKLKINIPISPNVDCSRVV